MPRSGYHGVYFHEKTGKWMAAIKIEGRSKYLGLFEDPKDAAKLYDEMVIELKKKRAELNFPRGAEDEKKKSERKARQTFSLPRGFGQEQ